MVTIFESESFLSRLGNVISLFDDTVDESVEMMASLNQSQKKLERRNNWNLVALSCNLPWSARESYYWDENVNWFENMQVKYFSTLDPMEAEFPISRRRKSNGNFWKPPFQFTYPPLRLYWFFTPSIPSSSLAIDWVTPSCPVTLQIYFEG